MNSGSVGRRIFTFVVVVLVLYVAGSVRADWDPGESYKMHFPQLPNPNGWDVKGSPPVALADDWLSTETGPVDDIHLWGSWKWDVPGVISSIGVVIFDNAPADFSSPHSRPGQRLWERSFGYGEFALRPYGTGDQGWYDPFTPEWELSNHSTFHQINFEDIDDPFIQEEGNIYWLAIHVFLDPSVWAEWGWKTSLDRFGDDGVWIDPPEPPLPWEELLDPITGESLDLAFVITPEPATLAVLLIGGIALLPYRRRRALV